MSCDSSPECTVYFQQPMMELRPYSINLRIDNGEFDFARAKFSKEVGDYIKEYVENEGEILRRPQVVEIRMEGDKTHTLYFRPEYVTFGETNTFIEFHDTLKHFEHSVIDFNLDKSSAKHAYKQIFNEADTGGIIQDINFQISKKAKTNKKSDKRWVVTQTFLDAPADAIGTVTGAPWEVAKGIKSWTTDYDEGIEFEKNTVLDTKFEFDIKNSSALDALTHINKQLGLTMFVDKDDVLQIGDRLARSKQHVASDNDNRVWTYTDPHIQPPTNPIRLVVVKGGMIDAPNSKTNENIVDSAVEFVSPVESHEKDLIAQGVAERTNLDYGKIVSVEAENVSRDGLETRAFNVMKDEISKNNSGTVTINPRNSGKEISDYRGITPGDVIELVPPDDPCRSFEYNAYLITGLEHDITGSSWEIELKIKSQVDGIASEIDTSLRYFNPDKNKYHNEDFEKIHTAN